MKFTEEQKKIIYEKYMKEIEKIFDEYDEITSISPKDIVKIILKIIEEEINEQPN